MSTNILARWRQMVVLILKSPLFSDSKQRLLLFEDGLLCLAPTIIIFSLRTYLPAAFWVCFLGGLVGVSLRGWRYKKSLKNAFITMFFLAACVAYILGLWKIYDIGTLFVYSDTWVYQEYSKLSLSNLRFWLFGGKPFVTALIFKVCQRDLAALNDVFIGLYLLASLIFMGVITLFWRTWQEKFLACYLLLLFFLNQHDMSVWLSCALSETPAIASTLLVFALCGLAYRYRAYWPKHPFQADLLVGVSILAAVFFGFVRDTNAYFLPILAVFYGIVLPKWRQKLLLGVCLLALFFVAKTTAEISGRWELSLGNVISLRILPDEGLRRIWQRDYAFPPDEVVMSCANVYYHVPCEGKKAIQTWMHAHQVRPYQDFLVKHPAYTLRTWITAWDEMQANLWRLDFKPIYYAAEQVRGKKLTEFVFNFPGQISLQLAALLGCVSLIYLKRQPLILVCLAYAVLISLLSLHGDAVEVTRHTQQPVMALKIALLLSVLQVYASIKAEYSGVHG